MTLTKRLLLAVLCLCLCFPGIAPAAEPERVTMTAETINYNMNTKTMTAVGNVVLKRAGSVLYGDYGEGTMENPVFELRGNVRGTFTEYQATLKSAQSIKWTESHLQDRDGTIEAFGGVAATRENGDYLNADYVKWELGAEEYKAEGAVDMLLEQHMLKAAAAERKGDTFWARRVTQYKDLKQNVSLAAQRVDGRIASTGEISEVVANGNVRIDYVDAEGLSNRLTGPKAIYSKARGTVVVSGGAKAVRSDGKTVTADTMVLHEETKNIEAMGNSSISFLMEEKKTEGKK